MKTLTVYLALLLTACSGSLTPGDAGTQTSAEDAAGSDTNIASSQCGFSGSMSAAVKAQVAPGDVPTGVGGDIVSGTYELTNVTYYRTSVNETWAGTLVVDETKYVMAMARNGVVSYESGTAKVAGKQVTIETLCPAERSNVVTLSHTASPSAFTFYTPKDERSLHFVKKI